MRRAFADDDLARIASALQREHFSLREIADVLDCSTTRAARLMKKGGSIRKLRPIKKGGSPSKLRWKKPA